MGNNNLDKNNFQLFKDFTPHSPEEWREKIIKDLKGADYDKKLIWSTIEGFEVEPFYTSKDLDDLSYLHCLPGEFPYVRSQKTKENNWYIRQDIKVDDLEAANKKALDILMKGIDSLGFILDNDKNYSYDDFDLLFNNIFAESVEINFAHKNAHSVVRIILDLVKNYNRNLSKINGSVNFDLLKKMMIKGIIPGSAEFENAKELIQLAEHLPNFRVLNVSGDIIHNSGSHTVQELAYSIAMGSEYLSHLTEHGLSVNEIAPRIQFTFATGSNYFMEIAKLRAARTLWSHIVKAYGCHSEEVAKMNISTRTSLWNKTIFDPYVNMLRTTTESMSSIIGGTLSHTVTPFNEVFDEPTGFSERIARNQQLLLKEESYLDKVVDPAAGSYYIENLTDSIINNAWELFLKVEEDGGFIESFKKGNIQNEISKTASKRHIAIATRKEILLGINQYPNFSETLDNNIIERQKIKQESKQGKNNFPLLKPYRGAITFEELRMATEVYAKKNKKPVVFMLTFGNLAMRRARAQFSSNFFGCAGYKIIDNIGFKNIEEGIKAARENNAGIVVLCSSDEEYGTIDKSQIEKIKSFSIPVIAGNPIDEVENLKNNGIEFFIHVRSNILETLQSFSTRLGIVK